uniref:Uncharacterized protein n=1 Tax=Phaffia rhodozyma TaxID=264483 RepID=Q9HFD7_PHARH|nr:hypothetical protein [Phaffia rhodozyma]
MSCPGCVAPPGLSSESSRSLPLASVRRATPSASCQPGHLPQVSRGRSERSGAPEPRLLFLSSTIPGPGAPDCSPLPLWGAG